MELPVEEEKNILESLEGQFRFKLSYLLFCNKLIDLYMRVNSEYLILSYDKEYKKIFKKIKLVSIVEINKRQLEMEDKYNFSIYYTENSKTNTLSEIKLMAITRSETNSWVDKLQNYIKPERYSFKNKKGGIKKKVKEKINNVLIKGNPKNIFIGVNNIQFIIERNFKILFLNNLLNEESKSCKSIKDTNINRIDSGVSQSFVSVDMKEENQNQFGSLESEDEETKRVDRMEFYKHPGVNFSDDEDIFTDVKLHTEKIKPEDENKMKLKSSITPSKEEVQKDLDDDETAK